MTDAANTVLAEQQLDPGIADVVIMLRNLGFNPTDSGDGRSKPDEERDFDVKHVACTVDRIKMFAEADRLSDVLGNGWKVEATYNPGDDFGDSAEPDAHGCILLATKNEEPGPRHQEAFTDWDHEVERSILIDNRASLVRAGLALRAALEHELGRR